VRGFFNPHISSKTDQVSMGQNGFFGIHTICLKVFRCTFKASGVGGGGAGGGSLPKKLLV